MSLPLSVLRRHLDYVHSNMLKLFVSTAVVKQLDLMIFASFFQLRCPMLSKRFYSFKIPQPGVPGNKVVFCSQGCSGSGSGAVQKIAFHSET